MILLDDLDRLDKEEILNGLKLIRTISDFNNVIFIVGYDRKYIVKTIDQPSDNYLDKIFNVELALLPFRENKLVDQLFLLVDDLYDKDNSFNKGFKELFEDKPSYNALDLSLMYDNNSSRLNKDIKLTYLNFLPTYRDVKRFINEFKFYASFLKNNEDVKY